ncbi:hypothetical protein TMES_15510 [Thalassospira mesophila]|uniref:Uncharacterized protein n=1 Tax=Thalassospira mesophila TaxID=1293891 RepID=A0A1Y2L0I3_9PROT|nr:hypothetical protein TMES_15510 [Thalassospira mesophila]
MKILYAHAIFDIGNAIKMIEDQDRIFVELPANVFRRAIFEKRAQSFVFYRNQRHAESFGHYQNGKHMSIRAQLYS